jgi:hypothetical protein
MAFQLEYEGAHPEWRDYVRVLERDDRDTDGKLLKCGSKVLCHPSEPETFREDSPANRQEFLRLDRTWSGAARVRVWFRSLSALPADIANQAEHCRSAKNEFLAAIDENMVSARGEPLPEVRSLPFWFALLAWEPRIKESSFVADLTDSLATKLAEHSGVPGEVSWPSDWRRWLTDLNGVKVYSLRGMTATVHVVAAFATGVAFKANCGPELLPPSQKVANLICEVYWEWSRSSAANQPAFTFFTIGSALEWPEQLPAHATGDHWLVVSSLRTDGTFKTSVPPRFADRLSLRNFLDRLKPETRQQRIFKIKQFVDERIQQGYGGNIHLDMIHNGTGYRRSSVRDALLALQNSGHYHLYKTPEGLLAVGARTTQLGAVITAAGLQRTWLAHLACLGPAVTVGVWFLKDVILGRPFDMWAFAALLPLAYAGEWLNTRFRKWQGNKE